LRQVAEDEIEDRIPRTGAGWDPTGGRHRPCSDHDSASPKATAVEFERRRARALTVLSSQSASFLQVDVRKPPGKLAF